MPTLKQLTCHIEWANSKVPFKEYGISYGDGSVDCYIPIPSTSTPFSISLTSNGLISSGLAMFVFMDGIYQCNRNKNGLICPVKKSGRSSVPKARDVGFRVRQKEEQLPNGRWVGKPWRFEPLRIVPDIPQIDPANFRDLGSIVVIVLRCQSRHETPESDGSRTPESSMAFGPVLDDAASINSEEIFIRGSPPSREAQEGTGFGEDLGLLFDGGNDYGYGPRFSYDYGNYAIEERSPCNCRRCANPHPDEMEERQPYATRISSSDEPWDAYNPISSPDSDRIRKSYRHIPVYEKTRSVPREKRNRHVRYERQPSYPEYKPDSPPLRYDQTAEPEGIQQETYRIPDGIGRGGDEPHSMPHKCTPSIVLNVNPGSICQEACERRSSSQHQSHCSHGKSVRIASGGCYTISNGKKVPGHCCGSHSHHACMQRENTLGNGETFKNNNNNNSNHGDTQNQASNWNTDTNGNQNGWTQTNGDSGANDNNTSAWPANPQEGNNHNNGNSNNDQPAWDSSDPAPDAHNVVDMTNDRDWQNQPEDNHNNDNAQENNWNNVPNDTTNNNDGDNSWSRPWGENTQTWQENTDCTNNNQNSAPNCDQGQTNNQPPQPAQFQAQPSANHSGVPEFVIPVPPEDGTGEQPLYTVPEGIAQAKSLSHQVQIGRPADYSHRVRVPEYFDTMEEPYAKFTFNYRVKEPIESKFGVSVERDIEAEKKILESLPRDQIVHQLLRARGLLGEQNNGNGYVLPNITTEPVFNSEPPMVQIGNGNMPITTHVGDNSQANTNHVHWNDNPAPNGHNDNSNTNNTNNNANHGEPVTVQSRFMTDYNNTNTNPAVQTNEPLPSNNNGNGNWNWNWNGNTQNNTTGWQQGDTSGHGHGDPNNNSNNYNTFGDTGGDQFRSNAGTVGTNGTAATNLNDNSGPSQWANGNGNAFNDAGNDAEGTW